MEELIFEFQQKVASVSTHFQRYLINEIGFQNRLIAIKGARGSGKTTLLLQISKLKLETAKSLYVSLDHIYFYDFKLYA